MGIAALAFDLGYPGCAGASGRCDIAFLEYRVCRDIMYMLREVIRLTSRVTITRMLTCPTDWTHTRVRRPSDSKEAHSAASMTFGNSFCYAV